MKRMSFLFLLAAIVISLFASQSYSVDLKKGGYVSTAPSPGDFAVSVNLLGEKGGVYDSGKEIRISFQTTRDGYVVVYNVDADGYVQLLYPEDGRLVRSEGRKTYFLPPPGTDQHWETGGTTGVEYIHAVAVTEANRINENELYYLARGDKLSDEKRLRIDMDPFLGFNMIDEELVRDAGNDPPVTDYTYFFVNRHVEYPRYLCSKCHSPEKLPDPYAMECPEIVIEKIAYDEDPHYPYPPLYDVRHVGEESAEASTSDQYSDKWLGDEDEGEATNADDTHLYLSLSYGGYYAPYYSSWPYTGPFFIGFDPFYWDVWGGIAWDWYWWDYNYWGPGYGWWGHGYRYPWWGCGDRWSYCDGGWGNGHNGYRPIYGQRTVSKKLINYGRTNTELTRSRSLAGSRLIQAKNRNVAARLDRSNLQRRTVERDLDRGTPRQSTRSVARNRELDRRIIYGGDTQKRSVDRTVKPTSRTRETNRTGRTIDRGTSQQNRSGNSRTPTRTRESSGRERDTDSGRDAVKRSEPERRSSDSGRHDSSTRSRSSDSSTHERSRSSDRSGSNTDKRRTSAVSTSNRTNGYQRSWSAAPARAYGSSASRSVAAAPARSSSAQGSGKTRSR